MPTRSRTYIARSRPVELQTEKVTAQQIVDTLEGPRTAFIGDYIMTGLQGEHWPVPANKFDHLYEVVEMVDAAKPIRVRKKIMEITVFQTYEAKTFETRGEKFYASVGDFIIRKTPDDIYPSKPDQFFEYYEILRSADSEEHFSV